MRRLTPGLAAVTWLLAVTLLAPTASAAPGQPASPWQLSVRDDFSTDTLKNYTSSGQVVLDSEAGTVVLGGGQESSAELIVPLPLSNNLEISGRVFVPKEGVGPYDSSALALIDASNDTHYWITIGYGDALGDSRFGVLANDQWLARSPLTLRPGLWTTIRVSTDARLLRAKAWADGEAEPGWQIWLPMNENWSTSGGVGFRHFGGPAAFDDLEVRDLGRNDEAALRARLPRPILDDHSDWIDLYWAAWKMAWKNIAFGKPGTGLASAYMDEAYNGDLFQWDTTFIVQFGRYGAQVFPVVEALDNWYGKQHANGFISRMIHGRDGTDFFDETASEAINPPLFAWAEWSYYELTGDSSRFGRVLPHLVSYYEWIKANHRRPNGLYWTDNLGSGMDNSPRDAADGWTDLTMQQALAARFIAAIARVAGQADLADQYQREWADLRELVNKLTWDPGDGFYYDLTGDGQFVRVKTPAAFWSLLAGLTNTDQAEALEKHLANPAEFWRPHVFPTLSADDPAYSLEGNYWRGAVWAPTDYMIIKGLDRYGFDDFAREAAINHIDNLTRVYQKTGTLWENYLAEGEGPGTFTGYGNRLALKDFVGWSGLGPIALLIEDVLGIRPDAGSSVLTWRLREPGRHGIENLRFGRRRVDLLAEPKDPRTNTRTLTLETDGAFILVVDGGDRTVTLNVPVGRSTFAISLEAPPTGTQKAVLPIVVK
jgi:hypothetical protein